MKSQGVRKLLVFFLVVIYFKRIHSFVDDSMNKKPDADFDIFPIYRKNHNNQERKVGFEIEYAGIDIKESIQLLKHLFSGYIKRLNKNEYLLQDSQLGEFKVELDAHLLKRMASQSEKNKHENKIDVYGAIENVISSTLENIIPLEIITPPMPIECIKCLEPLIDGLRKKNALGTSSSKISAFGVHINPDVPSLSVDCILQYLKAYILLADWLRNDIKVNMTRILSSFVNEYPNAYKKKILNPNYFPSMDKLINDYIHYNPTRNRAFDMLPLFTYINKEYVQQKIDSKLTNARPSFHYRLANSNLNISNWNIMIEWGRWLYVEKLAADIKLQQELANQYLSLEKQSILFKKDQWIKIIADHLQDL